MPDTLETARRAFLRRIAAFGAAVPLAGITVASPAFAQEQAKAGHALNYVWQGGDDEWGGCQHPQFRNVQVNSNGWCRGYAPGG